MPFILVLYCGLGHDYQHSHTASILIKLKDVLFAPVLLLSTVEIRYLEGKNNASEIESTFPSP